jgi:diguanylate cyclase (GGDEF)-like protein
MFEEVKKAIEAIRTRKDLDRELKRLRKLVFYDDLTGILNRKGFREDAEKAFSAVSYPRKRSERRAGVHIPFCILFIDLDNFKKVNDTMGHKMGDEVLKKVGALLRRSLRTRDIIGRWGGEEFVVALLGTRAETARKVAERLRWDIQHLSFRKAGKTFRVTASIGIAPHNGERDLSELVNKGDEAMYQAKKKGKNRVIELK